MILVSHDPEVGTLYWYFTEIAEGAVSEEGECDALLLLDHDGQVIGFELELDSNIHQTDLTLALSHPGVSYDPAEFRLTVRLSDQEPAEVRPIEEPAILDFDAAGSLLGCEILPAEEFELAGRLTQLADYLVAVEDQPEAAAIPMPRPTVVSAEPPATPPGFRAGFVALVGRPNVGKSTLMNALLGQKVAIVSPRPQTTRMQMRGILTRPDAQIVFVDTPGIHAPKNRLGNFMVEQARRAMPDADLICFMVDIGAPPGQLDQRIAGMIKRIKTKKLLVLNKIDEHHEHGAENLMAYRALGEWDMEVAISALRREGLETLLEEIIRRLPPSQLLYPEGQITDQSQRERAAELVREQALRLTDQEVPHGVAVEVEEWQEKEHALYIRMTIYVEKDSQKGILIGAKGAMLKEIGSRARTGIQKVVGRPVYLDLWVKARPNWRDDPSSLHWLGYKD